MLSYLFVLAKKIIDLKFFVELCSIPLSNNNAYDVQISTQYVYISTMFPNNTHQNHENVILEFRRLTWAEGRPHANINRGMSLYISSCIALNSQHSSAAQAAIAAAVDTITGEEKRPVSDSSYYESDSSYYSYWGGCDYLDETDVDDWEQQRQNLMVGEYKDPIVSLRKVVKRTAAAIRLQCWFRELRKKKNKKKSWVQVLKHGLSKGFRNPKQEAELAKLHFVWKARKERLEAFKRIWRIHARQEQEQRAWEMKRAKRMDRDEKEDHWLKRMWWEGEQVREDMRKDRLDSLRNRKKELQRRMQNVADHSDYWHGGHDARLNSLTNTEYKTMWEGMENQMDDLDNDIFDQECEW